MFIFVFHDTPGLTTAVPCISLCFMSLSIIGLTGNICLSFLLTLHRDTLTHPAAPQLTPPPHPPDAYCSTVIQWIHSDTHRTQGFSIVSTKGNLH